jgi:hypothetical protein
VISSQSLSNRLLDGKTAWNTRSYDSIVFDLVPFFIRQVCWDKQALKEILYFRH